MLFQVISPNSASRSSMINLNQTYFTVALQQNLYNVKLKVKIKEQMPKR